MTVDRFPDDEFGNGKMKLGLFQWTTRRDFLKKLGGALVLLPLGAVPTIPFGEIIRGEVGYSTHERSKAKFLADPPGETLGGMIIDQMDSLDGWQATMGNGANSATLTTATGRNGAAIQLAYDLGTNQGAWVQFRRDFEPPLDLSAYDHLRFYYQGTAMNSLLELMRAVPLISVTRNRTQIKIEKISVYQRSSSASHKGFKALRVLTQLNSSDKVNHQ